MLNVFDFYFSSVTFIASVIYFASARGSQRESRGAGGGGGWTNTVVAHGSRYSGCSGAVSVSVSLGHKRKLSAAKRGAWPAAGGLKKHRHMHSQNWDTTEKQNKNTELYIARDGKHYWWASCKQSRSGGNAGISTGKADCSVVKLTHWGDTRHRLHTLEHKLISYCCDMLHTHVTGRQHRIRYTSTAHERAVHARAFSRIHWQSAHTLTRNR